MTSPAARLLTANSTPIGFEDLGPSNRQIQLAASGHE
jgi:hypothetical protein